MEIMDACTEHFDDRIKDGMSKSDIPAQISSYEKNYPQISAVFYFEKTSNRIFTGGGEMSYADFERQIQTEYGVNLTGMAFYSTLCQTQVDDTLVSRTPDDDESNRYLFYIKVLPRLDPAPKRVMVFMLPIHAVIGRLDEYVPGGYSVYSYSDRYLTYLVQKGDGYQTSRLQSQLDMLQSENLTRANIDGQKYALLRVKSGVDGMYHMIAYRESTLYRGAYQSIMRSFLPVLIILAITAAAAFAMHRYFYKGVERILALPFPAENALHLSPMNISSGTRLLLARDQLQAANVETIVYSDLTFTLRLPVSELLAAMQNGDVLTVQLREIELPHLERTIIHLSLNLSGTALDLSGAKLELPQSPALLIPEGESPRLFRRTDCPRAGFYLQ